MSEKETKIKNLQDERERLIKKHGNDPELKAELYKVVDAINERIKALLEADNEIN